VTAFLFSGCQSPRRTGSLSGLFASKNVANQNPEQPKEEPFILTRDEKKQGDSNSTRELSKTQPSPNMFPSMNTHDQETLTYIDRELSDATPQEREKWFKTLKPLSPDQVQLVLQTRRIGIERDRQKTNGNLRTQNTPRTGSYQSQSFLSERTQNREKRSSQPDDVHSSNPPLMQQPPHGPFGYSNRQTKNSLSQPGRMTAPNPRVQASTSHEIVGSAEGRTQENKLFPPPAPGVRRHQSSQQSSSPLNAIQIPQQPLPTPEPNQILAKTNTQSLPKPSQPLQVEKQGANILWNEEILRIISLTESDVARMTPGTTDDEMRRYTEKHVFLRMLYLMAGKQAQAFEAIPRISPEDQEFWQQTLWGIANYFYAEAMPEKADRAAQTLAQIRNAIQSLQGTANLEIKNVSFCKKITNFGNFEKFDRDEFRPGDMVLIYAEVENFKSESSEGGKFRTVMKSDIEILRSGVNGGRIDQKEYSPAEDFCSSPRKDYFHAYRYEIPRTATLGPHVLKLTIEDQLGGKVASYTMNFTIK